MKYRPFIFVLLLISLALWTWKLLEPNPLPPKIKELVSFSEWFEFILAKLLHAGAYAYCSVLAVWSFSSKRAKYAMIAVMLLHGIGTEIGQSFVPNRYGSVRDVMIDFFGVAMGVLFARQFPKL